MISFILKVDDRWPVEWISANIAQFGYSSEEFMNGKMDYADIIYVQDYDRILIEVNKLTNKPETSYFTLLYRVLTKSGEIRFVIERSFIIRDLDGNITHFRGIIIDNTEKKLLKSSLKKINEKYNLIFETAPIAIICFDENGTIVKYNKKCLNIFDESYGLVGLNILKYIKNSQFKAAVDLVFLGEIGSYEGEFISINGKKTFIKANFSPMMNEDGSLIGGVGIIEDITKHQKSEYQIHLNEARLETLVKLHQQSDSSISQIIEYVLEKATLLTHSETGYLNFLNEGSNHLELYEWSINNNKHIKTVSPVRSKGIWGEAIRNRKPTFNNLSNSYIEIIPDMNIFVNRYVSIPIANKEQVVAVAVLINKLDNYDSSDIQQLSLLFDGTWETIKFRQSQEKLIDAQNLLKMMEIVVNDSPAIIFMWTPEKDWPVKFVSKNITKLGYTVDDFISGKILYGNIIHPEDVDKVRTEVTRCYTEGYSDYSQEYRILTKSGEIRWIDERTIINRDSQGKLDYLQGIVVDITSSKQANIFTHIEADFSSDDFLKNNIENAFNKILDFAIQIETIDCGAIYLINDENKNFDLIAHKGLSDIFVKNLRNFGPDTIQARLFKTGYPVYKHFSEINIMLKEKMINEKLQAMAFIPVQHKKKLIASLILCSYNDLEIPADSRNVIDTISQQLKALVMRFKEKEINTNNNVNNNNQLKNFFHSIDDLVFVINKSGLITYINDSAQKHLKYSLKTIFEMDFLELFPPENENGVLASINIENIMDGTSSRCHVPLMDKDHNLLSADTKFFIDKWDGEEVFIAISRLG